MDGDHDMSWREIKQYWSFDGRLLAGSITEHGDVCVSE